MRVLRAAQAERFLCECAFSYDEGHWYCYVLGSSDRLICFAVEDDFLLNGFVIGRLSDLRLAKPCGALFDRMCRECGLPGQLCLCKSIFLPGSLSFAVCSVWGA